MAVWAGLMGVELCDICDTEHRPHSHEKLKDEINRQQLDVI